MYAIGYFNGTGRRGLLVFAEPEGQPPHAVGGFEPGRPAPEDAQCVVTTDTESVLFTGWPHPDTISWALGPTRGRWWYAEGILGTRIPPGN